MSPLPRAGKKKRGAIYRAALFGLVESGGEKKENLVKSETGEKTMARQRRVVERMIGLYCRGRHGSRRREFCPRCEELRRYALRRLEGCPFGSEKPNCSSCRVHCYAPAMRERIREVMRYAGPRMLWHYPGDALVYLWRKVRIRPKDYPGR